MTLLALVGGFYNYIFRFCLLACETAAMLRVALSRPAQVMVRRLFGTKFTNTARGPNTNRAIEI